jgi:multicomponent Na+:H+ antiporter subunit B
MRQRLIILQVAAGPLYWLILAASLWVLLRGHNEPGGGFIGGLVAVSASILWAVAQGSDAAVRRLPLRDPVLLAASGVALGALAGVVGLLQGQTFLTHWWVAGPLSTVLLFDIGVYLCVWGALAGYALALLDVDEADPDADSSRNTARDRP